GCRAADLGGEAESLLLRKRGAEAVDLEDQGVATLPDLEFRVGLHDRAPGGGGRRTATPVRVDAAQEGGQAARDGLAVDAPFEGAGLPPGRRRCAGAKGLAACSPRYHHGRP